MTASRLVLQSAIVLTACLVGFVMGRFGAAVRSPAGPAAVPADRLAGEPVWDFDATGSPGGSFPVTTDAAVDSTSGFGADNDRGPNRQFFPEALGGGSGPRPFGGPRSADPIRGGAPAATEGQVRALIEQELPDASDLDKNVWAEELDGLSLDSVRAILQLKQSLGPLEGLPDPPETDLARDAADLDR